jgi:hypothetical protein
MRVPYFIALGLKAQDKLDSLAKLGNGGKVLPSVKGLKDLVAEQTIKLTPSRRGRSKWPVSVESAAAVRLVQRRFFG